MMWEPVNSSIAYWRSWSRAMRDLVDASRGRRCHQGRAAKAIQCAGPVCAQSVTLLSRRLSQAAGTRARSARIAGHDQAGVDGTISTVGSPTLRSDLAGVTAFIADRAHIGERYLDRYVIWKSSGSTGEPGDLCAGRRRAGNVRRAHGRASRSDALRVATFLGPSGERRAGGAGGRDRRSFRQHRLVAARMSKQSMDFRTQAFPSWTHCRASLPH